MSFPPIQPAAPADLEAALDLLRRSDLPETGVAEQWEGFLVAREHGRLVGVCGLEVHGPDGLLRSLAVEPARRGSGLGGELVRAVVEMARRRRLRALYLLTTTARPFFLGHSFADTPRDAAPEGIRDCWEYRAGCPASSAFMSRPL